MAKDSNASAAVNIKLASVSTYLWVTSDSAFWLLIPKTSYLNKGYLLDLQEKKTARSGFAEVEHLYHL